MRRTTVLALLLSLAIPSAAVHAASVTVSVVQNERAPVIAIDMSRTIEDELMGGYFDAGHIVSSTSIRLDGSKFAQKNFGIKEAAFGYSDYLLAVYLEYGPNELKIEEKKITYAELRTIVWRVVDVKTSKILEEKTIDVTKIRVTDFDPYEQSRLIADTVMNASLERLAKQN
jgi:hypothetical protein